MVILFDILLFQNQKTIFESTRIFRFESVLKSIKSNYFQTIFIEQKSIQ